MKKYLNLEIFITLGAIFIVSILLFVEYNYKKSTFLEEKLNDFDVLYQSQLYENHKLTTAYMETVLGEESVVDILESANKNENKAQNREKLIKLLGHHYKNMQKNGILQFQFHLANGESFVRFHKLDSFGDNVSNRISIQRVMKMKQKVEGFEIGKFSEDFRYIIPIFKNNHYIGSVEASVGIETFMREMKQFIDGRYTFAIKKDHLETMIDKKHIKNHYHPFLANTQYLMANAINKEDVKAAKSALKKILLDIQTQIESSKPFINGAYDENHNFTIFSFLPIKDINNEQIGYVVSIRIDNSLDEIRDMQLIKFSIAFIMIILLFIFYRSNKKGINTIKQLEEAINLTTLVSKTNTKGVITYANDSFVEISGYSKEELIGKNHNIIRHPDMPKEIFAELWEKIKNKQIFRGIIKNRKKDGSAYYVDSMVMPLLDINGNIEEYIGIRHNITDIMNPKRQFLEELASSKKPIAMMGELKNYQLLREFYGEEFIQYLEEYIQKHILELLPPESQMKKVYRLDSGIFAFLKSTTESINPDAIELCLKKFLINIKSHIVIINTQRVDLDFYFAFTTQKEDAFENLSIGLEIAKSNKQDVIFSNQYASKQKTDAKNNIIVADMLKHAINNTSNAKIISYFQPVMNNLTGTIDKYESLVRLIHEDGSVIAPYFFIDIAKKTGHYANLTKIVLKNSFEALNDTQREITINLSTLDIENLTIRNLLLEYITVPQYYGRIVFELLEDEVARDFTVVKDFISFAKAVGGVKIAIDDFGSGYSNFERLLDFQPDILKIDGSLIKNIVNDPFSKHVVEAIVLFAKKEKIQTVAEFIADKDILEEVKKLQIDYSQGFYIGKPDRLDLHEVTYHEGFVLN